MLFCKSDAVSEEESNGKPYCLKHMQKGPRDDELRTTMGQLKLEKNNLKQLKIHGKFFFYSNFKHYRKKNEGY